MTTKTIQPLEKTYKLITTKTTFIITLIVIGLTTMGVNYFDVGKHRTLFQNSIISLSILSGSLLLFLTIGLYFGIKLKDNLGKITDQKNKTTLASLLPTDVPPFPFEPGGLIEVLLGLLVWCFLMLAMIVLAWLATEIVTVLILLFGAMLYWVFFRALRIVFKKSSQCKNNLVKSVGYGLLYTLLYMCWIYGIVFGLHYWTQWMHQ